MATTGTRRRIAAAAVGALALLALTYILSRGPARPALLTAPVVRGDVERSVLAGGTIEPFKLISVGAQASGRILALHVALGDQVRKGQLIAEIDPSTEKNALTTAQATLDQARAQHDSRIQALKEDDQALKRARTTFAQEASSQADLESAEAAYYGAEQDVRALAAAERAAQIAVDTARVNLGFTKVIAPLDGTVVAIVTPEGQTVNAVQSAPTIVKLADLSTMTVKAQISEADVNHVKPGQAVYFTTLGNANRRYWGTLRAVAPAPDSIATDTASPAGVSASAGSTSSAVYYSGLFEVANPDRELRTSMTAEVHIVVGEAKNVLTIPVSALRELYPDGTYGVSVIDARGRPLARWVRIGIQSSTTAEVREGLNAGEEVVVGDDSITKGPRRSPGVF